MSGLSQKSLKTVADYAAWYYRRDRESGDYPTMTFAEMEAWRIIRDAIGAEPDVI